MAGNKVVQACSHLMYEQGSLVMQQTGRCERDTPTQSQQSRGGNEVRDQAFQHVHYSSGHVLISSDPTEQNTPQSSHATETTNICFVCENSHWGVLTSASASYLRGLLSSCILLLLSSSFLCLGTCTRDTNIEKNFK